MNIRIEPGKLERIRDFLNAVIEDNKLHEEKHGVILDSGAHFTRVKQVITCTKCGQEYKPSKRLQICPNCEEILFGVRVRFEPIGYKNRPGAQV